MPVSVNASPTKVYVFLFLLVVIGYGALIISRSLKRTNKDMEHFVEQNPDYKFRLEVMKVFDLYMNRNPTPDEINKYAGIQNEQDILLTILKDFNITASDVNKEKLAKWAVAVEEEFSEQPTQSKPLIDAPLLPRLANDTSDITPQQIPVPNPVSTPGDNNTTSTAVPMPDIDIDKIVAESRKQAGYVDTWSEKNSEEKVVIPAKLYEELQSKVTELHAAINRLKPMQ